MESSGEGAGIRALHGEAQGKVSVAFVLQSSKAIALTPRFPPPCLASVVPWECGDYMGLSPISETGVKANGTGALVWRRERQRSPPPPAPASPRVCYLCRVTNHHKLVA